MGNTNKKFARPTLTFLTPEQLDTIHRASLSILSETGLNVHSEPVRDMMASAGAKVKDNLRVFIDSDLVEKSLKSAPSCINVYDRNRNQSMCLEGTNTYFGTGSDLNFTVDSQSQQRRESTLKDVELSARLCEKLENIDFVMSYAIPTDIPQSKYETEQFRVMLENTTKPIMMTVFSGLEAFENMHKMACESCGGQDEFSQSPNYIVYGQFVSPLQHDSDAQ